MSDFTDLLDWNEERGTRQLLIRQNGATILEQYWDSDPDTTFDIASMQKAPSAVVLGQLVGEGLLDLDAPLSTYVGEGWTKATAEQEARITVRHVVSMRSGLNDAFEFDTDPGGDWYYNNGAYHQVRRAMELVTGQESGPLFAERLWAPLGMAATSWKPRPGMTDPHGWVLSGIHSTARDLAAFGTAVLDRDPALGCSDAYLDEMLTGTPTNPSYGLLWWLYGPERAVVPGHRKDQPFDEKKVFGGVTLDRRRAASAPTDTIGANGAGDQRIYLVPSHRLVIVRVGDATEFNAAGGPFDEAFWSRMPPEMRSLSTTRNPS